MILDADLTGAARGLAAILRGVALRHGEFITGVRLVYRWKRRPCRAQLPRQQLFSLAFSWILASP